MKFSSDVKIENDLDEALDNHSQKFYKWARAAAKAEKEKNNLKLAIDVIAAERGRLIREDPEAFGLNKKPTEKSIAEALTLDKKVIEANKKYFAAIEKWKILQAAEESFKQRRKMIEKKIEGRIAGIFSTPNPK